jgi:hypothetical protein
MTSWTDEDLRVIGDADEWQIASLRADGTLRPYVTIWGVRAGDDLYVRSAYGPDNPWYRRAKASGAGRIRAGGQERDVTFADTDASLRGDIDAVYHGKYDSYGPKIVGPVVDDTAASVTIRLVPRA